MRDARDSKGDSGFDEHSSSSYIKIDDPWEYVTARAAEMEASLPESVLAAHPIQSIDEIGHLHVNFWVGVLPTGFDSRTIGVTGGRVLVHCRSRAALMRRVKRWHDEYPGIGLYTYFVPEPEALVWPPAWLTDLRGSDLDARE